MKKFRLGVVGLGHRGREMGKLAANFDCVELVAGCDVIEKNWYETQWLSNAPMSEMFPNAVFYKDYEKMLDEANLDVVLVETGADIHCEFCCKALKKNINVLSDIPLVASLQEADDIWKAAQESTAMISVGANPNYQRFADMLVEFYQKGLLGKPYCMEAEYIHWEMPNSTTSIHLNENGDWRKLLCPIRYCTHSLGPLLRILDEELRYVSCFGSGSFADDVDNGFGDGVEDTQAPKHFVKADMQCAQFLTESGVVIRLMRNGRCRAQIGHHNYRVFGTEGYMERIDRFNKPVIRYNSMKELDTSLKEVDGKFMPVAYEANPEAAKGHGGMDYAMVDAFLKALLNNEPAPVSVKAGLAMTLPGIYAEESAKQNGKVLKMKYPWDPDWSVNFEDVE